jgi:hypothetical protein
VIKTCEYDNTIRPEVWTHDTIIDELRSLLFSEAVFEIGSDNLRSGSIDEIPVVDVIDVREVELSEFEDGVSLFLSSRSMKRSSVLFFRNLDCHVVRHGDRLTPRNDGSHFRPLNQTEHSGEAFLMKLGIQEDFDFLEIHLSEILLHDFPRIRNLDAEKTVSLTIFSFSSLEKTRENRGFVWICQ